MYMPSLADCLVTLHAKLVYELDGSDVLPIGCFDQHEEWKHLRWASEGPPCLLGHDNFQLNRFDDVFDAFSRIRDGQSIYGYDVEDNIWHRAKLEFFG